MQLLYSLSKNKKRKDREFEKAVNAEIKRRERRDNRIALRTIVTLPYILLFHAFKFSVELIVFIVENSYFPYIARYIFKKDIYKGYLEYGRYEGINITDIRITGNSYITMGGSIQPFIHFPDYKKYFEIKIDYHGIVKTNTWYFRFKNVDPLVFSKYLSGRAEEINREENRKGKNKYPKVGFIGFYVK